MTKRLVEIDDDDLRAAQLAGGYATIKETVAAGLRELVAITARRELVELLTSSYQAEFQDKQVRRDAWR